jgi:alcohol dehydrogenase (cytochrome c)
VFDADSGRELFSFYAGGSIASGVSTYTVGSQQYIAVSTGNVSKSLWNNSGSGTVIVFGLR